MSWDIVLFNSRKKIESPDKIDEKQLEPTDFCSVFETHFEDVIKNGNYREVKGPNFTIDYFVDEELASNLVLSLYGEDSLYEIIVLARKYNWQVFDTGIEQMLDLTNPAINGYNTFQNYLEGVLKVRGPE